MQQITPKSRTPLCKHAMAILVPDATAAAMENTIWLTPQITPLFEKDKSEVSW